MWIMRDKLQAHYAVINLYNLEKKLPFKENEDAFQWLGHCLNVLLIHDVEYTIYKDVGKALEKLEKVNTTKGTEQYHADLILFFKKLHVGTAEAKYIHGDGWRTYWTDRDGLLGSNYRMLRCKYKNDFKYEDKSGSTGFMD